MENKSLCRPCPSCGRILRHKLVGDFNRAARLNSRCVQCATNLSNEKRFGKEYIVDTKSGCWLWNRTIIHGGYAMRNGRLAHRAYYEKHIGKIPPDKELDHLCHTRDLTCEGGDNCLHRRCVNPDHLEPVSRWVNVRRGRKSKINMSIATEIRSLAGAVKQRDIAKKFNISQRLVWGIIHGRTWVNE